MGKSQARSQFLPLVQSVVETGQTVEITDHGNVLLSHREYLRLVALAHESPSPKRSPVGSMILLEELEGDQTAELMNQSLLRRASEL